MGAHIASVNIARELVPNEAGFGGMTGIDKRPVADRVAFRDNAVAGDHVHDTRHHGGYDQAVYAYASEDAAWWAAELGRELSPGSFGENLSTRGVDVTNAVIGERWAVGTTLLEVSCPRIPCRVFKNFLDIDKWIKRFTVQGWPGAYLRIITEGEVGAGDGVVIAHRPAHGVTIGEVFRGFSGERSLAPRLLLAEELPEENLDRVRAWLAGTAKPFELDGD